MLSCNKQHSCWCKREGWCVADPYADDFKRFAANVPVVTYAINDRSADVFAEKVSLGIWETDMIVKTPIGYLNIITPLIGRNNVYNVLAAVATGLSINIPLKVSSCFCSPFFCVPACCLSLCVVLQTQLVLPYQVDTARPQAQHLDIVSC